VSFDITSEYPNEGDTLEHLGKAIDGIKALITEKGLKLAGAE
jgi:hypothetical protein